ncbi:MAG TPA: acyl carrier protein [Terriglobales bacterium]|nr:acyl carrier protein [Terriglobales bacterium]
MDDIRQRLIACFQVVFPNLPQEKIPGASPETVAEWDSVAGLTLMNVVEDEFGLQIDLDDLAGLDSFEKYRAYLEGRAASA